MSRTKKNTCTAIVPICSGTHAARIAAVSHVNQMCSRELAQLHLQAVKDIIDNGEIHLRDYEDEDSAFSRYDFLKLDSALAQIVERVGHIRAVVRESAQGGGS